MPFPTAQELDYAYEAGATSLPESKNPYFWSTPLWMQWECGRLDNPRRFVQSSKNRLRTVGHYALLSAVVGMVASVATYYLTH